MSVFASSPQITRAREFTAERAWGAKTIAVMNGIGTRLHWTDQPYRWHTNDGAEVFVVLDGTVCMRWREAGEERNTQLHPGDVFCAPVGTEHLAEPQGVARVLVVETEGSP